MYGKLFAKAFTGSMFGSGATVFAVWAYVIANADLDGTVELNPLMLASVIGEPVEAIEAAIATLCAPDPRSRNPEHEGRRLLATEVSYLYAVTSHRIYQAIRNNADRREYNRVKQAESRARKRSLVNDILDSQQMSAASAHGSGDVPADDRPTTEAEILEVSKRYPRPRVRLTAQQRREKLELEAEDGSEVRT